VTRPLRLLVLFAAASVGASCQTAPKCVDNGNCAELQACVDEVCVDVQCTASSYCGIEQFCDTRNWTCKDGCSVDTDCPAGKECNEASHQCEFYECRATDLDCPLGEFCDPDTGRCEEPDEPHCDECDDPLYGTGCGSSGTCFAFDETGSDAYCLIDCDPDDGDDACPRGYECVDVGSITPSYICYAHCPTVHEFD
jgi:hypothetical protein